MAWRGDHDFDNLDIGRDCVIPNAILRLLQNLIVHNFDSSGMGPGNDVVDESMDAFERDFNSEIGVHHQEDDDHDGSVIAVRKMSLSIFRRKLVEHFHIMWSCNKIVWPTVKQRLDDQESCR